MPDHFLRRGCAAACLYAFASHAALADVTAQDVWSGWKSFLESAGYAVSGSETTSGNALIVHDFAVSQQLPDDAGRISVTMDQLIFAENGDGTVSITMPGHVPMQFDGLDGKDGNSARIDIAQSDAALIVSGSPQDMTYDYAAAQCEIALGNLTVNGEPLPPELGHLTVGLSKIASKANLKVGDMRSYTKQTNVATVSYDMAFRDPDTGQRATFRGGLDGVSIASSGTIPPQGNSADFGAMLASGLAVDITFSYAKGHTGMSVRADDQTFDFTGSSQGGEIRVALDAGRFAYGVSQTAPMMNISASDLPFPLALQAGEMGFSIEVPVAKSDDPQPFGLGLTLADFILPEQVWSMLDPAGILPRDPATIAIDLSGKARILYDLMDPATVAILDQTGMPPGELHALTINDLRLSAAGASLKGRGEFTFDNSDLQSFGGVPRPEGVANLTLRGANGLIDRLIQMGLVTEDEAMGYRMMLSMLAVPDDAPDTLKSTIEINAQGQVLANGQRIK